MNNTMFSGLGPRPQTREDEPKRGRPPGASGKKTSREKRLLPPMPNKWGLTRTEAYIISRRASGDELTLIAKEMCIAVKTASTYTQRAIEKMGVRNIVQCVVMWDREFYIRPVALTYEEVMRINLGRDPTDAERHMNLHTWEVNPSVFNYAVELARAKLADDHVLSVELAARRIGRTPS